ncbi:hypothetical protein [Desulfoplanes sp.]
MPIARPYLALLLPALVVLSACSRVPDHKPVFETVDLYTKSIDLTLQMIANDAIYERLEQSLPNIKRAHGLEEEHCLILTGWAPFDRECKNAPIERIVHELEKTDWHLHKKNPNKQITSRLVSSRPCALEFTMVYTVDDKAYVDMGMDVITRDNYLFSVKIHGNATVMNRENTRFMQEFEHIRQTLKTLNSPGLPRT